MSINKNSAKAREVEAVEMWDNRRFFHISRGCV
nr:MAG TPA: hypothetical protein [Microviridae sp.]